jgi:hypothetical protein
VTVHVAEPRRIVSLVLAVMLIAAVVLIMFALAGSPEGVPVGRS